MPGSRESSVWRTLAVAFGDGLAFGVGLTLTSNATRSATAKTQGSYPDIRPLADRIAEIEQRMDRTRPVGSLAAPNANGATAAKVAEAVLTAMDGRFGEIGEQMEQRLAELEGKLKRELEALESRDGSRAEGLAAGAESRMEALRAELIAAIEAQRIRTDSDLRVLRSQMMELHKQFAETLARLVDEQIEHTIALRLQAIQEQMRETVREESQSTCQGFEKSAEALIESRILAFRDEQNGKDRQMADLRTRLDGSEHNMLELVLALGRNCLQAAERITPESGPNPAANGSGGGAGGASETYIAAVEICEVPAFARQAPPKRPWRVPFVSCFLMATTGLLALHYLVV